MKKEMTQVAVSTTDDGYICIAQDDPTDHNFDAVIQIAPEQAKMLCGWIESAADELERGEGA